MACDVTYSDESEYRHEVVSWFDNNKLQLNASKIREINVDFRKRKTVFAPIFIYGYSIERVECLKCLGTMISCDWVGKVTEMLL